MFAVMFDHQHVNFHEVDLEQNVIGKLVQIAAPHIVVREMKVGGSLGNALNRALWRYAV